MVCLLGLRFCSCFDFGPQPQTANKTATQPKSLLCGFSVLSVFCFYRFIPQPKPQPQTAYRKPQNRNRNIRVWCQHTKPRCELRYQKTYQNPPSYVIAQFTWERCEIVVPFMWRSPHLFIFKPSYGIYVTQGRHSCRNCCTSPRFLSTDACSA